MQPLASTGTSARFLMLTPAVKVTLEVPGRAGAPGGQVAGVGGTDHAEVDPHPGGAQRGDREHAHLSGRERGVDRPRVVGAPVRLLDGEHVVLRWVGRWWGRGAAGDAVEHGSVEDVVHVEAAGDRRMCVRARPLPHISAVLRAFRPAAGGLVAGVVIGEPQRVLGTGLAPLLNSRHESRSRVESGSQSDE